MKGPSTYCPKYMFLPHLQRMRMNFHLFWGVQIIFVAPSLLLSRWNYYVAYLFDMNMLPIWEVHMTEELVWGNFFFGSNLVNYKYITCSLLCSLYTCWMCLIQIRQKYFRCSSVRKHNFGFILCFVYQLSNCFCFFGRAGVC